MPASQAVHEATFDAVEYLPTVHAVHIVAPSAEPVFVIEPAAQVVHDATLDASEYVPAPHDVQLAAPVAAPVSVIEPAWQLSQYDWPSVLWNFPVSHASHDLCFACDW